MDNTLRRHWLPGLETFDLIMLIVVIVLLAVLGVVVLRGDQIGISVQKFGPSEVLSSKAAVEVTFNEPIQPDSAQSHINITPDVAGKVSLSDQVLRFQPAAAFQAGQTYTLTVQPGIVAKSGRLLKTAATWRFSVRTPRFVYLGPTDSVIQNLYLFDPAGSGTPEKLTDSAQGLSGFDVAPDGSKIVYAELLDSGTSRLSLWDATTRKSKVVLTCGDGLCANPVWRPDGTTIAFEKQPAKTLVRATHVWLLDTAANTAAPLYKDSQQLSEQPHWSPDGSHLAALSANMGTLLVHNFGDNSDKSIPFSRDTYGMFSPDGRWLYFSKDVSPAKGLIATHLVLIDLSTDPYTSRDLLPDTDTANDQEAIWRADSKGLIVVRHQPFSQKTPPGSQLVSVDLDTGTGTPITENDGSEQRNIKLSPAGDSILFEKIVPGKPNIPPDLWTVDLASGAQKLILKAGADPRWLP